MIRQRKSALSSILEAHQKASEIMSQLMQVVLAFTLVSKVVDEFKDNLL